MTETLYQSAKITRDKPLSTSRRNLVISSGKYSSSASTINNVPTRSIDDLSIYNSIQYQQLIIIFITIPHVNVDLYTCFWPTAIILNHVQMNGLKKKNRNIVCNLKLLKNIIHFLVINTADLPYCFASKQVKGDPSTSTKYPLLQR